MNMVAFVVAAVIFFLNAAGIPRNEIDIQWGLFAIAVGLALDCLPSVWWPIRHRRPQA